MRKVLLVIATVVVTLGLVAGGYWYYKTLPARRYEAETEKLRRIVDRQGLEIKAYQYSQTINKIKAAAEKAKEKKGIKMPVADPNK